MQKRQGISLIVLVITIIVMVILAGAIILTLNNSGIISKASDAVNKTNDAQINQLAQLAWAEAYADGYRTQEDLERETLAHLDNAGLTEEQLADYRIIVSETGVNVIKGTEPVYGVNDPLLNHAGVLPEGASLNDLISLDSKYVRDAGEKFYEIELGDEEIFYQYFYDGYRYAYGNCFGYEDINGWSVEISDKNNVGEYVLESIAGIPVVKAGGDTEFTFKNNTTITKAPAFPSNIQIDSMDEMFYGCTSLTDISNLVIPEGVTSVDYMFYNCTSLKDASKLTIPEGVTSMEWIFGYTKIIDLSTIVIPKSVTNMRAAFYACRSLIKVPIIPENVTCIAGTFAACTALEGDVVINATINLDPNIVDGYFGCFDGLSDMSKINLICAEDLKEVLLQTTDDVF